MTTALNHSWGETVKAEASNKKLQPMSAFSALKIERMKKLTPSEFIDFLIKNKLIKITKKSSDVFSPQVISDLRKIASTKSGRALLMEISIGRNQINNENGIFIHIDKNPVIDASESSYYNFRNYTIHLAESLFRENCSMVVGDRISAADSFLVLFHELVHAHQFFQLAPESIDKIDIERDAVDRTDKFTVEFNQLHSANYPQRVDVISQTKLNAIVCPQNEVKNNIPTPQTLSAMYSEIIADFNSKTGKRRKIQRPGESSIVGFFGLSQAFDRMALLYKIKYKHFFKNMQLIKTPEQANAQSALILLEKLIAYLNGLHIYDLSDLKTAVERYAQIHAQFFRSVSAGPQVQQHSTMPLLGPERLAQ